MRKLVAIVAGALALGCGSMVQAQTQPRPSQLPPEAAHYRTLLIMQEIDTRCPNLTYGERTTLRDFALGAMLEIPEVASLDAGEIGYEAYFDGIGKVTEPIAAEAKSLALSAPCDQAPNILGRFKTDMMVNVIAHLQLGREAFEANATDLQKRMAGNMIGALRQMAASGPEGALEQAVGAQMQRIKLTPEEAAQNARAFLGNYIISAALNGHGYTLRWSEAGQGWDLVSLASGERAGLELYIEPRIAAYYRMSSGPEDFFRTYEAETKILVLPQKHDTILGFIAFPLDPSVELPPSAAAVSPRYFSEDNVKNSPFGCVEGAQCFRLSPETTRLLHSRAGDSDLYKGAQLAIYAQHPDGEKASVQLLNDRVRENQPEIDYLPLRQMIGE